MGCNKYIEQFKYSKNHYYIFFKIKLINQLKKTLTLTLIARLFTLTKAGKLIKPSKTERILILIKIVIVFRETLHHSTFWLCTFLF